MAQTTDTIDLISAFQHFSMGYAYYEDDQHTTTHHDALTIPKAFVSLMTHVITCMRMGLSFRFRDEVYFACL